MSKELSAMSRLAYLVLKPGGQEGEWPSVQRKKSRLIEGPEPTDKILSCSNSSHEQEFSMVPEILDVHGIRSER